MQDYTPSNPYPVLTWQPEPISPLDIYRGLTHLAEFALSHFAQNNSRRALRLNIY